MLNRTHAGINVKEHFSAPPLARAVHFGRASSAGKLMRYSLTVKSLRFRVGYV